ncbi:MAG: hypothetical protein WCK77_22390 [Verrucomicrobiota bacterium]
MATWTDSTKCMWIDNSGLQYSRSLPCSVSPDAASIVIRFFADPRAGTNAGCVIERSAKGYAIRSAIPVGKNDWVVCATNDYLAIESGDVSDLPSEIGATSCNRYHKVITGLRNARLGLDDSEMVGVKDVRRILASTRFGCTVHSTVFDASDSKDLPWE